MTLVCEVYASYVRTGCEDS